MPYSIEKQREASRLAMRRLRQRRKVQLRLYEHQQDILRHIDRYEFWIGDREFAIVEKKKHDEFIETASKLGLPADMKRYVVVEAKDSTTSVVRAKTIPELFGRPIKSMVTSIAPQGGKPQSIRVDGGTHREFVKWARERGLDTCYLLTSFEASVMEGEPIAMGGNIYVINLYSSYVVEKPRRVHVRERKTVFEREVWLGDGNGAYVPKGE